LRSLAAGGAAIGVCFAFYTWLSHGAGLADAASHTEAGAVAEPISAHGSFGERFAFYRPDASVQAAQAAMSFDERFSGDALTSGGQVRSAATALRTTLTRPATVAGQRLATHAVVAHAASNRATKRRYQIASASETSLSLSYAPADSAISSEAGSQKGSVQTDSDPLADVDTSHTAIYDIMSHTVYLPNGRRLEAHSGLGSDMDDPRSVTRRNTGATPPNVYELKMRESLFHGVRALRLIPKDDSRMHGRGGILAHSYMLGPNGQSNGCVSFSDYAAFLDAYQRGDVTRLVVVKHLAEAPLPKAAADWFSNTVKAIFRRS
jgi:hypothetical protein